MKRGAVAAATLAIVMIVASPVALATGSDEAAGARVRQSWLSRLDPDVLIPADLALRFARAAVAEGLTEGQAARMLNDERFAAAIGAPDQGYGLLEGMIQEPSYIANAQALLEDPDLTSSGADSLQNALMSLMPELRNAYLEDLGLMAVEAPTGVLVLVDIETGRQYVGNGHLGAQLRAPGGGPLPLPSMSPGQADVVAEASTTPSPPLGGLWQVPADRPERGLVTPGLYVGAGLFLIAWAAYAVIAVVRRLRSDRTAP